MSQEPSKQDTDIEDTLPHTGSSLSADKEKKQNHEAASSTATGNTTDTSGDSEEELEKMLDDTDEFQEIDLFGEGLLNDIHEPAENSQAGGEDLPNTNNAESHAQEDPLSSLTPADNDLVSQDTKMQLEAGELPDDLQENVQGESVSAPGPENKADITSEADDAHDKVQEQPDILETDHDSSDDDSGISLSDDELWDDSMDDDIPLFDNEPDTPVASSDPTDPPASTDKDDETAAPDEEDHPDAQEITPSAEKNPGEAGEHAGYTEDHSRQETTVEHVITVGGAGPEWLPWVLSGFFSCILLGGIFIMWGMLTSSHMTRPMQGAVSEQEKSAGHIANRNMTVMKNLPPMKKRPSSEALSLAPFIIPVQRRGELVFFKLTVELIVPDMQTKHALKKREAWVRDAVYTELKGIEVGPGTKGEFLQSYRRPLKKRIEKELAPLEIRDVRLMGYVLK